MAVVSTELIEREARGVRGRFAVDVWQQWVDLEPAKRLRFLSGYGVPAERLEPVAARIADLLEAEGI